MGEKQRLLLGGMTALVLAAASKPSLPGFYLWEDGLGDRQILCFRAGSEPAEYYGTFYYLGAPSSDFIAVADLALTYKAMFAKEVCRLVTLPAE